MSRITDILTRMRDSLADEDKTRWSDARLIRLIDEAQKDLVQESKMLRTRVDVAIRGSQAEYSLPTDAYLLSRVVDKDGRKVPVLTHTNMDELQGDPAVLQFIENRAWEKDEGNEIKAIIFDKQNPRQFKVYPIPIDPDALGDSFSASDYGIVAAIEGDLVVDDFGVIGDVTYSGIDTTTFSSPYGVTTEMANVIASLTVYYRKLSATLTSTADIPEVDAIWDKALRYYALAMAFADDKDTQNLAMSDKYMGMYLRDTGRANTTSSRNNAGPMTRRTTYNRAI